MHNNNRQNAPNLTFRKTIVKFKLTVLLANVEILYYKSW